MKFTVKLYGIIDKRSEEDILQKPANALRQPQLTSSFSPLKKEKKKNQEIKI